MRCLSCNVGEYDIYGEPSYIENNYCKDCRRILNVNTDRSN